MKCSRCKGRKYIELDKIGLVVKECPECKGTGEVEEAGIICDALSKGVATSETLVLSEKMGDGESLEELEDKAHKIIESQVANDDRDRAERDNSDPGSTDTSKPKQQKKPKAKRKARKRTR